jgi:hypothetical protein
MLHLALKLKFSSSGLFFVLKFYILYVKFKLWFKIITEIDICVFQL